MPLNYILWKCKARYKFSKSQEEKINQLMFIDVVNLFAKNEKQIRNHNTDSENIQCCGLQIRPVEEQLKQRVIGERYCISRKKEVIQKKY